MKTQVFSILPLLLFGVIGCAMLQETPPVEIAASRLTCEKNPDMVDGDLSTVGTFRASGTIRKGFERTGIRHRQYQRRVEGSLKTETLIKLDAPIYIAYLDVYPASTIPNFTLDATAEEKSSKWMLSFAAVEDKRAKKVEGTRPVRFQIGREILYLRLTAYALEDLENVEHRDEEHEMRIPLKGASIREVRFFGR